MKSLLERENPLYGRHHLTIDLKPMDYYDAARFYPDFSAEDKVRLYSVFGGIPYYTRLINPKLSVRENIIELISEPGRTPGKRGLNVPQLGDLENRKRQRGLRGTGRRTL